MYLCLAIFWSALIVFLCLVQLHNAPFKSVSNLDKLVHIFFHFVFTVLWFLYFQIQFSKQKYSKSLLISVLFSFSFGIAIEILQEYCTKSRRADFYDVFANLFGAILAFGLVFCWNTFSLNQMKK